MAKVIEDVRGEGEITTESGTTKITYGLTITETAQSLSGSGQIIGPEKALYEAITEGGAILHLNDGRRAEVVISNYYAGKGLADFKMNGGFLDPVEWIT